MGERGGVIIESFVALVLNGGEWSTSHPSRFTPGRKSMVSV